MIQRLLQEAYLAIGRLDGAAAILPNLAELQYIHLFKEAVLSSQIEGTQSSLEDFLAYEEGKKLSDNPLDIAEVFNYVPAVQYGLDQVKRSGLSIELLETLHGNLITQERADGETNGRLRTRQNYIVGRHQTFVPPPPELVRPKLENLLAYIENAEAPAGILPKAAIAHLQFATIHPFMDGNGRLGRMLITLLLCHSGLLRTPILTLSLFLKRNRAEYYTLLADAREHGDLESWLAFFLRGVIETAQSNASAAVAIAGLFAEDRRRAEQAGAGVLLAYEQLIRDPVISAATLSERINKTELTARKTLVKLMELGICTETTQRQRNRRYKYTKYLELLNAGTESGSPV